MIHLTLSAAGRRRLVDALAEAGPIRLAIAAARASDYATIRNAPPQARATAAILLDRLGYNGRQIGQVLEVPLRTARRWPLAGHSGCQPAPGDPSWPLTGQPSGFRFRARRRGSRADPARATPPRP